MSGQATMKLQMFSSPPSRSSIISIIIIHNLSPQKETKMGADHPAFTLAGLRE